MIAINIYISIYSDNLLRKRQKDVQKIQKAKISLSSVLILIAISFLLAIIFGLIFRK